MSSAGFPIIIVASVLVIMAASPAFAVANALPIFIPRTGTAAPTIDGVWSTSDEWTKASETFVDYVDGTQLVIRGKHDIDTLYVLLEMPDDYVLDGRAGICFDTQSDGGLYMKTDDYCFVLGNTLEEFHGDGKTTLMHEVIMSPDVAAARGLSGLKSPYESDKDHVTYEFKVPVGYLGSDGTEYGFYVVYDTRGQTTNYTYYYSWPDYKSESSLRVISPRDWGQVVISSDVNVPEFPLLMIPVIAGAVGIVAMLTRISSFKSIS